MTTIAATGSHPATPRDGLTTREVAFVLAVRSGATHADALVAAGYSCSSPASASAMLRKLVARPRVITAIGHDARIVRRRRARESVLALLPARERQLVALALEVALEATRAGMRAPHGGPALSPHEANLVSDLRAQLVELEDAERDSDAPQSDMAPDAPEADHADVERGAP